MKRWRRVAATVVVGALLLFAVRAFVGDVYAVRSASMEPCLHGGQDGEWVLVRYGVRREPRRFDLVVFERPGEPAPIVKRVLGLPGESLQLVEGDLWIDGQRLPADAQRPPWVLLFDSGKQPLSAWFDFKPEPFGPWRRGWAPLAEGSLAPPPPPPPAGPDEPWRLEALALLPGDNAGLMFFDQEATTGYLDGSGRSVAQPIEASDLALEVELCATQVARRGELRLRLLEKGDFFQARLCLNAEGPIEVLLEREPGSAGQPADLLARGELPRSLFGALPSQPDPSFAAELSAPPAGPWVHLAFENRDDHLRLRLDGREVLSARYEQNRPYPGILPPGRQSVGPRAAFGGAGVQAAFRGVRLWRDQQWLSSSVHGPHGSATRLTLGPDEFFVAGDNSFDSTDSRYFGPIPRRALLGRPLAVCWPPSRWRRL